MAYIPSNYKSLEHDYRDKALKLFPWVCGKCAREFVYSNLKELTVHHMDENVATATYNPFADLLSKMNK